MNEQQMREECAKIQEEWQMCGLAGGGIYEDFAVELAKRAVAAERERCAKIADEHAKRNYPWGSENSDVYHAQAHWAERIAKAIRA